MSLLITFLLHHHAFVRMQTFNVHSTVHTVFAIFMLLAVPIHIPDALETAPNVYCIKGINNRQLFILA